MRKTKKKDNMVRAWVWCVFPAEVEYYGNGQFGEVQMTDGFFNWTFDWLCILFTRMNEVICDMAGVEPQFVVRLSKRDVKRVMAREKDRTGP